MITLLAFLSAIASDGSQPDCKTIMGDGGPQQEMNFCASKAWHDADAELNRTWSRTKAIMHAKDLAGSASCYPAVPNNGPKCLGYEEALVKAQRAWISFRDAECVVGGYAARASDVEAMLVSQCREDLTRKRIKVLTDTIDDFSKAR